MSHSDKTSSDQSAERRLAGLVEAGMILASEVDLELLLQRIADLARDVIGARYAAVGVLGDDDALVRFIYSGIDNRTAELIGHLPLPDGPVHGGLRRLWSSSGNGSLEGRPDEALILPQGKDIS